MMERMNSGQRHVLLIGLSPEALDSVRPALDEAWFEVHTVDPSPFVLDLIRGTPFELLVLAFPNDGLEIEEVVTAARCPGSQCTHAGLIVVTKPEHLEEAGAWLDKGVNRIVTLDWPRSRIWQAFTDLLKVSPRIPMEAPIQLIVPEDIARDSILLRTENISESGALLTGFRTLPLGTRFEFELVIPGTSLPIRGTAEVVRRTSPEREGCEGFGIRYLNLSDEGQKYLLNFIELNQTN